MGHIQIKNAPDELHDRVRARARERSMTVRDYVLDAVRRDLDRPTLDSWLAELRVERDGRAQTRPIDVVEELHAGRAEREAELLARVPR